MGVNWGVQESRPEGLNGNKRTDSTLGPATCPLIHSVRDGVRCSGGVLCPTEIRLSGYSQPLKSSAMSPHLRYYLLSHWQVQGSSAGEVPEPGSPPEESESRLRGPI